MKKTAKILIMLTLLLSLSACGKSEVATAVDEQIAAIGQVTLESEALISAAESAVADLPEEDLGQLENIELLDSARTTYESLVMEAEAAKVDEAIAGIGAVSLDSEAVISSARSLFNACAPDIQALVENLNILETAEAELDNLFVKHVSALINDIGKVSLESQEKIQAAQDAYDKLSSETAEKIRNSDLLKLASVELTTLKQEQAQALLANMRLEEDRVRGIKFYYPDAFKFYSNGSWAADQRSFVLPYFGMDSSGSWLRLICNYTADDWVFFDSMTFAVDDLRYYKYFSYYDIVRDNGGGDVWEYIDLDVSASDIEMLWEIVNSTETIIRFEGSDYFSDFIVTESDKRAIKDVLTVYQALQG